MMASRPAKLPPWAAAAPPLNTVGLGLPGVTGVTGVVGMIRVAGGVVGKAIVELLPIVVLPMSPVEAGSALVLLSTDVEPSLVAPLTTTREDVEESLEAPLTMTIEEEVEPMLVVCMIQEVYVDVAGVAEMVMYMVLAPAQASLDVSAEALVCEGAKSKLKDDSPAARPATVDGTEVVGVEVEELVAVGGNKLSHASMWDDKKQWVYDSVEVLETMVVEVEVANMVVSEPGVVGTPVQSRAT